MEKGARRTGKSAWEIARLYTDAFLADIKLLDIEDPTILCRATDHIREQIDFIADIEKNGFAYITADGVYFDTSKQPDYGYLARLDVNGSTSATSGIRRTSRSGNSRRPARNARWSGTARGAAGIRDGTSSARRWRRDTWVIISTFIAVAKTTSPSITPMRSRRPRRVSAHGSPISGCTATSCSATTPRWRSPRANSCAFQYCRIAASIRSPTATFASRRITGRR